MSNRHLDHIFAHGPHGQADRLVLLALADRAQADTGCCNPSMADIAARCGMSDRGARKVVRRLEASGWLEVDVNRGRGNRSRYRAILRPPQAPENRNEKTGTRDRFRDKTGTRVRENRNHRSAEPYREPLDDGGGQRAREPSATEIEASAATLPPERQAAPELLGSGDVQTWREQILEVLGPNVNRRRICDPTDMLEVRRWETDLGLTKPETLAVIEHVMASKGDGPPSRLRYFNRPMERFADAKAAQLLRQQQPRSGQRNERNHNHHHDGKVVSIRRGAPAGARASGRSGSGHKAAAAAEWPVNLPGGQPGHGRSPR